MARFSKDLRPVFLTGHRDLARPSDNVSQTIDTVGYKRVSSIGTPDWGYLHVVIADSMSKAFPWTESGELYRRTQNNR